MCLTVIGYMEIANENRINVKLEFLHNRRYNNADESQKSVISFAHEMMNFMDENP